MHNNQTSFSWIKKDLNLSAKEWDRGQA